MNKVVSVGSTTVNVNEDIRSKLNELGPLFDAAIESVAGSTKAALGVLKGKAAPEAGTQYTYSIAWTKLSGIKQGLAGIDVGLGQAPPQSFSDLSAKLTELVKEFKSKIPNPFAKK